MKQNTTKQPLEDSKVVEDKIRESHKNMAKGSKEGLHTQGWTRGSNYGGECNLIDWNGHIVGVNVDSDAADLIVKAVNERKALLDSHEKLLQALKDIFQYDQENTWVGRTALKAINNAKNIK